MAVSITSRPALWSAARNPVVYKFETTGTFTNYRIEVEVFNAEDDTSLTGGVTFAFSPDANAITIVDVSQILRAHLARDWSFISGSPISAVEDGASIQFYIKYQEVYDGASTLVQDDGANPRFAVNGALQIPSAVGNDMDVYVPEDDSKKFLTLFDRVPMWRGYQSTLSMIYPEALTTGSVLQRQFAVNGSLVRLTVNSIASNQENNVIRIRPVDIQSTARTIELEVGKPPAQPAGYTEPITVQDSDFTIGVGGVWSNAGGGGGVTPWVNGSGYVQVSASVRSTVLQQTLEHNLANRYLKVDISAQWPATSSYVLKVFMEGVEVSASPPAAGAGTPTTTTLYINTLGTAPKFDFGIMAERVSGDTAVVQVHEVTITEGPFVPWLEPKTLEIHEPCRNPVMLFWKNSLGGDAWWLFHVDQEVGYDFQTSKTKRVRLFANNLTANQWEALNELQTIGQLYKRNIREFTSSVDRTHIRDGAQVYVVDKSGNKIGVIVHPQTNLMFTRQRRHRFEVEIEFPERYE